MTFDQLIAMDKAFSLKLAKQTNGRFLRYLAWTIARTGDSWFWLLLTAILLWQKQPLGWNLLTTVLTTAVIVYICKIIFKRERPDKFHLAIGGDRYAFPSGHAARSGAVAITLLMAFPHLMVVWLAWAILVSIARVALSRHYLTDVAGGLMLGLIVSAGLQNIL